MVNNAVTYERNAQTRFFLCRSCHNHVLPGNDIRAVNLSTSGDTVRVLCLQPVNVRVEPSDVMFFRFLPYVRLSSLGQIRVAYHSYPMATMDIHCNVCNTYLGHRRTLHPVLGPGWPNPVMPRRRGSILHLDQLLYWNGTRMIYADTHQPASPNHQ